MKDLVDIDNYEYPRKKTESDEEFKLATEGLYLF